MRRKKKIVVPVLAVLLAFAGYFYNNYFDAGKSTGGVTHIVEIPEKVSNPGREGLYSNGYIKAQVTDVVDGDTLEVRYKSREYKVRLLDVDTPESKKAGVPVQEFAKEATRFTTDSVLNKEVKLVFEKGLRDRYGRLLAHVIFDEDKFLNGLLVRNGFARVEIVKPNSLNEDYFYNLMEAAIRDKTGLWSMPEEQRPFVKNAKGQYVPDYYLEQKEAS